MKRLALLSLTSLLLGLACSAGPEDDTSSESPAPRASRAALADPAAARSLPPVFVRKPWQGPKSFIGAGDACPVPPAAPLVLPNTDSWGGLVALKDVSRTLFLAPIHATVTIDGDLLMLGFSRTSGDFSPATLDVSPTFLMKPDLFTDTDAIQTAEIFSVPHDTPTDSFVCAGQTLLDDGRVMVVGGTRIATFATSDLGQREFGLNYGAIFGPSGWVRIPRDFIGGESWYPTLVRLSDGRLMQYSGYFELDAILAKAKITFNRTMQIFDPKRLDDPWTVVSPTSATPEGTQPVNYTWIYELPTPVAAAGAERQLFVMGSGGATYLMNHLDPFPEPAARFVARTPRPLRTIEPPEQIPAGAATLMLLPYFREPEKLWYRPGSVIIFGGGEEVDTQEQSDVYDPTIDKWCPATKALGIRRRNAVGLHLPDGNVILINGETLPAKDPAKVQLTPQIMDPRTGAITTVKPEPTISATRAYHNVAALLPDGRIFVSGGRTYSQAVDAPDERSDARYYSPYYLGILPPSDRPQIIGIPSDPVMHYDREYVVDYKNGEITGAALVGLTSMTHATDFNARYIELDLRGGEGPRGQVTLAGPQSGRLAPPGHYMLFLLRKVRGVSVPSVAQIIRVDGDSPTCEGAPINACGGCRPLARPPGAPCMDVCGAGTIKCDGPNRTSCNACL